MLNGLVVIMVQNCQADYKKASRSEKKAMLDHLQLCSRKGAKGRAVSRKHLIKLLGLSSEVLKQKQLSDRRGRPRVYNDLVVGHILRLHKLMLKPCAQRMKAAVEDWLPYYEKHYGYLTPEMRTQIKTISSASIERILRSYRQNIKGKTSTRPNENMKSVIPLKRLDEQVKGPGTIQADTVAHCGTSLQGDFINTLTCTDVCTHWTETRACWTKKDILSAIRYIEKHMPILFRKFDTDCGSEFLNRKTVNYFMHNPKRRQAVELRRARPYKKNDQCYVEQRNNTHVRGVTGYERLDDASLIEIMNRIYEIKNKLNNYFLPTFKLASKRRVGGKIKKTFEVPKTPAQRILEASNYPKRIKLKVQFERASLDPIKLKKELEAALKIFNQKVDALKRATS